MVPTVLYFLTNIAQILTHPVLYSPDVVYNTRKQHTYLRFSERIQKYFILLLHRWQHLSIQTNIYYLKHWFCLCCTGKYSTVGGVLKLHTALGSALCCMSLSTPLRVLYLMYNTRTRILPFVNIVSTR